MESIGTILAQLHGTGIIHGDLTTSNMMLRLTPNSPSGKAYEIVSWSITSLGSKLTSQVLIDFGLSSQAQYAENYAVDLYVLERAFASTHPASEGLHAGVSYQNSEEVKADIR
jgi:TP53 regulating kinase-like protein